ncbi:MAG TPA: TetR/AcrR family transcriptional regulator [Solirubrobacterales bacterium]
MTGSPEDLRRWRLPRGRHGLPRELVTRSQRERLQAAVVRVTAEKGYEATTVADILEEAGVGRESFYELFDDKRDCMLSAHAILVDDLERQVRAAYLREGPWVERLCNALAVALGWFAADPAAARFTLIELAAVGPEYHVHFQAAFKRFVALLDEGIEQDEPGSGLAKASSLALSAIWARVYEEVVLGRTAELPSLLPDLTYELLVPYLGEEGARSEQRRVAAGGP